MGEDVIVPVVVVVCYGLAKGESFAVREGERHARNPIKVNEEGEKRIPFSFSFSRPPKGSADLAHEHTAIRIR